MFCLLLILLILLISIFMFLLNFYLMNLNFKKFMMKMEIECGIFSCMNKNFSSIIYSMFMIIFLIFDLEITLLFITICNMMNLMYLLFFILIIFSLLLELYEMSLKWND